MVTQQAMVTRINSFIAINEDAGKLIELIKLYDNDEKTMQAIVDMIMPKMK